MKKALFLNFSTFAIYPKLHLKAKNTFGGSPEPPEVSGGAPRQTEMDCIERGKYCNDCQMIRLGIDC